MKINITLPVYNEEKALAESVPRLISFLKTSHFPYRYEIVIADNASTDTTGIVGRKLAKRYPCVSYTHIPRKGRGHALRECWSSTACDIVSYMDIDLSSDMHAFRPLIDAVAKDGAAVAIGSRLSKGSTVIGRKLSREVLSRGYNTLIRLLFHAPFRDAQCGFKALRADYFREIEPHIKDNSWFFDTEILLLTAHFGRKIRPIPLRWTDDRSTTVNVPKTIHEKIGSIVRMKWALWFDNGIREERRRHRQGRVQP